MNPLLRVKHFLRGIVILAVVRVARVVNNLF